MLALAIPAMMLASNGDKVAYKVNTTMSNVTWNGYKVTGEHQGTIGIESGMIQMEGDKIVGGEFVIDMSSLTVTDLDGDMKGKLEGHLKSDDFFGVQTFPTATMKITKAKAKADGYHITADLTIKEKTHPIEFVAVMSTEQDHMKANAKITIDRSKYDVRYGSNSFFDNLGDKAIYDNFDLNIELVISQEAS